MVSNFRMSQGLFYRLIDQSAQRWPAVFLSEFELFFLQLIQTYSNPVCSLSFSLLNCLTFKNSTSGIQSNRVSLLSCSSPLVSQLAALWMIHIPHHSSTDTLRPTPNRHLTYRQTVSSLIHHPLISHIVFFSRKLKFLHICTSLHYVHTYSHADSVFDVRRLVFYHLTNFEVINGVIAALRENRTNPPGVAPFVILCSRSSAFTVIKQGIILKHILFNFDFLSLVLYQHQRNSIITCRNWKTTFPSHLWILTQLESLQLSPTQQIEPASSSLSFKAPPAAFLEESRRPSHICLFKMLTHIIQSCT